MDCITILAQAVEAAGKTPEAPEAVEELFLPVRLIWEQVTLLDKVEALTFISFGVVWLFYGWRVFKILVTISFGLIGLFVGLKINEMLVGGNGLWLGIIFLVICALLSVSLVRWAVSILGALAGGILTGGIWYACNLPENHIWAGALIGVIAGGMISFIIFRIAVMLFTSMGGSVLIVVGFLALLYLYPQTTEQVKELMLAKKWFLPAALLIPTVVGVILQSRFVKGSRNWSV